MVARGWLPVFCLTAMLGALPATADTNILSGRVNPDGTPDADFGAEVAAPGLVSSDLGAVAAGSAIVAQTIGGTDFIVVAGSSGGDFAVLRLGLDGSLDINFGVNGVVITDLGGVDRATAVAIQTIGGIDYIVVAGNSGGDFAVVRYNTDGTPDITFGLGGVAITDLGADATAAAMALQTIMATSRIVVAGSSSGDVALVRYDENGLPDGSFNGTGIRILDVGDAATTAAVAIQSDNRIVAAGGIGGDFLLVRFDASGALDMTFDGGVVQTDFAGGDAAAAAVLVEPVSQDLIAVGHSDADLALARYDPGGTLDSGFGMLGRVVTDVSGAGAARGAVLGPSADIFVVGGVDDDALLAHYLAGGGLDPVFGQGGLATTNYLGGIGAAAAVILLAGDLFFTGSTGEPAADLRIAILAAPDPVPAGQLLVYTVSVTNDGPGSAADVTVSSAFSPGAAFVASQGCAEDPDGAPTCSLGTIAAAETVPFTLSVIANRLAPSPLTAQVAVTSSTIDRYPDDLEASAATELERGEPPLLDGPGVLAGRVSSSGDLDPTFGNTAPGFLFDVVDVDPVVAAVVQSTGAGDRLLFAGLSAGDLVVARFTLDGALDPDFGTDGIEVTDFGAAFTPAAMAIQVIAGEARIVVAGSQAGDFLVARFKEDGGLDPTFDGDGFAITDLGVAATAAAVAATTTAVVVAGTLGNDLVLVRYDAAGVPDPTFDGDGIAILDSGGIDRAAAVAVVPGDAVVLLGTSDGNFLVARFSNIGMLDPAFGAGGLRFVDFGGDDLASAMLVDGAQNVLVAGTSDGDFALAKLNADGSLNGTFGIGGLVRVDLGSPAELTGLAFSGSGIVALGRLGITAALMRFTASGTVDAFFGMGGLAIFSVAGTEFHPATAIGLDDQVIFTGGTTQVPPTPTATASSTPTRTRTATQTGTATNTATATPAPNGAACDDPIGCVSGNCVDDTCCLSPACNPGESCGLPGSAGVCTVITAAAPTLSPFGLLVALASLLSVGGVAVLRRRRQT